MLQIKKRLNFNCPRCDSLDKHTEHVLQCQSDSVYELRYNLILEMIIWMKILQTYYGIKQLIYTGLISWLFFEIIAFKLDTLVHTSLLKVFRYQLLLGWRFLLFGFVPKFLVISQQHYYTKILSRKIVTRWGV